MVDWRPSHFDIFDMELMSNHMGIIWRTEETSLAVNSPQWQRLRLLISCFLLLHFRLEFIELCSHTRIHGRSKGSAIYSSFSLCIVIAQYFLCDPRALLLPIIFVAIGVHIIAYYFLCDHRTFAEHEVSSRSALFPQYKSLTIRVQKKKKKYIYIYNNNAIVWAKINNETFLAHAPIRSALATLTKTKDCWCSVWVYQSLA